jgi:hypothetical protein
VQGPDADVARGRQAWADAAWLDASAYLSRADERLVRICEVEVVSVRREPLCAIDQADVVREGFRSMTPAGLIEFFCEHMKCTAGTEITRIESRHLA